MDELVESLSRRLPAASYEFRVSFRDSAPWLAGLSAALDLLLGGRGALLIEMISATFSGFGVPVLGLVALVPTVLCIAAIPGLRALRSSGWWLFFVALLIDLLFAIITVSVLTILFSGIFLYLLLQVHEYYWQRPRRMW